MVSRYDQTAKQTFRHAADVNVGGRAAMAALVSYGVMAANSHNTQPWRFRVAERSIRIEPDFTRRCPVVDPDDHHLWASLGCAAENILVAAGAFGLRGEPAFLDGPVPRLELSFEPTSVSAAAAFQAIPHRQCTRAAFSGAPVEAALVTDAERQAQTADVEIRILTAAKDMAAFADYVIAGNSAQLDDKAFVRELGSWIRFNETEALRTLDGLTYRSAGSPSLPSQLGRLLLPLILRKGPENDKYRRQIDSSAGIAVLTCASQSKQGWTAVGRAYERFALELTTAGVRHAFINQPVERPEIRAQLAGYLNLGDRLPDLIIRFGYGEQTPRTLRRPAEAVMEEAP